MYLAQWGWLGSRSEAEGWGYRKCRLSAKSSFFFLGGGVGVGGILGGWGGWGCLTWWGFIFWKGERVCELLQRSSAQLHTLMVMCVCVDAVVVLVHWRMHSTGREDCWCGRFVWHDPAGAWVGLTLIIVCSVLTEFYGMGKMDVSLMMLNVLHCHSVLNVI